MKDNVKVFAGDVKRLFEEALDNEEYANALRDAVECLLSMCDNVLDGSYHFKGGQRT